MDTENIRFRDYPELDKLCWNEHLETIPAKIAFLRYLDQWDFVSKRHMTSKECTLIHQLNNRFNRLINVQEIAPPAN
jgi:hypothetical protein